MTSNTKGKGRPKGSEKNDNHVLATIANMIFVDPELRPTTAMRHIQPKATDSEIRRWQAKWKERKVTLLAEARSRADEQQHRDEERAIEKLQHRNIAVSEALRGTQAMRAALGLDIGPAIKAYLDSPAMRMIRELEDNPTMRLIRKMEDNPTMRLIRKMQDGLAGWPGRTSSN